MISTGQADVPAPRSDANPGLSCEFLANFGPQLNSTADCHKERKGAGAADNDCGATTPGAEGRRVRTGCHGAVGRNRRLEEFGRGIAARASAELLDVTPGPVPGAQAAQIVEDGSRRVKGDDLRCGRGLRPQIQRAVNAGNLPVSRAAVFRRSGHPSASLIRSLPVNGRDNVLVLAYWQVSSQAPV